MKVLQFREAIAEAMSEEMRRDESVYLMGEEVAEYNGADKASNGACSDYEYVQCCSFLQAFDECG